MANGDLHKLGTFYLNGTRRAFPTYPWNTGYIPPGAPGSGNIPTFANGQSIEVRDTYNSDGYKLRWREVNVGVKKLLISDRVLLTNVSWDDLNTQGLIAGKNITIDGQQYRIRALTGGSYYRTFTDRYSGGRPSDNEWDSMVVNEGRYSGLPVPTAGDLDSTTDETDRVGAHNQFWNWYYVNSWAQEVFENNPASRIFRGHESARHFAPNTASYRSDSVGWRPVLEVLNQPPTLTLSSPANNQTLSEGNKLPVEGSATDPDVNDPVTIYLQVNNGTPVAIHSGVSDGSTAISFAKQLEYRNKRIYYGATDLTGSDLAESTDHLLKVWASDNQGGKSTEVTRKFRVSHNRAPVLNVDSYTPSQSGLIDPDNIVLSGTANDPDGDRITVTAKLNAGATQTLLQGVTNGNWTFTAPVGTLNAGANILTITATDEFGSSTSRTFNLGKTDQKTPIKIGVARYKVLPPLGKAQAILAWLKREKGDLAIYAEASFVNAGQREKYEACLDYSVDLTTEIAEDEFVYAAGADKTNIIFKLIFTRANVASTQAATSLVGAIE